MDATAVLKLFDFWWFEQEILHRKPIILSSGASQDHKFRQFEEMEPHKAKFSSLPELHLRCLSDELNPKRSLEDFSPCLKTGTLCSDTGEEEEEETERVSSSSAPPPEKIMGIEEARRKEKGGMGSQKNKGLSKSLSDLEIEEVKGFMDLGFVFSEEDMKDSSLASVIPGLQRLGKKEEEENLPGNDSEISRPYLSEVWEVLGRGKTPWIKWKISASNDDLDVKDNLRWWAHAVASAVR